MLPVSWLAGQSFAGSLEPTRNVIDCSARRANSTGDSSNFPICHIVRTWAGAGVIGKKASRQRLFQNRIAVNAVRECFISRGEAEHEEKICMLLTLEYNSEGAFLTVTIKSMSETARCQ
jgi:hypothetical protein